MLFILKQNWWFSWKEILGVTLNQGKNFLCIRVLYRNFCHHLSTANLHALLLLNIDFWGGFGPSRKLSLFVYCCRSILGAHFPNNSSLRHVLCAQEQTESNLTWLRVFDIRWTSHATQSLFLHILGIFKYRIICPPLVYWLNTLLETNPCHYLNFEDIFSFFV